MKLHLPIALFTALMAVMTALPSFADVTVKKGEESVELTEYEESERGAKGYSYDFGTVTDGVTITITGEGEYSEFKLGEGTTQLGGNTVIDVTGKCYWEGKGSSYAVLAYNGGSATIDVHDGGLFVNNGYIAWHNDGKSQTTATINIYDGGRLQDGKNGSYAHNKGDQVTINVKEGGTLSSSCTYANNGEVTINVEGGSVETGRSDTRYAYSSDGHIIVNVSGVGETEGVVDFRDIGSMAYNGKATIAVNDGGVLKIGEATMGRNSGSYVSLTVNKGGRVEISHESPRNGCRFTYETGSTADIIINGGEFIGQNVNYGDAGHKTRAGSSHIIVKNGGFYREAGDDASFVNVTIDVQGSDSVFELHDSGYSNSAYANFTNCEINVDGGTFKFTSEDADEHPRAEIKDSNRFVLSNGGTIEIGQAFVDASYSYDWMINPNLTIKGGNLVNAQKMSGDCTINIDSGYTGVNSLGGLLPEHITEFKVNGANTWFDEIGDGTITLQGGDSITLGASSVWVKGSEEGADSRHAAFQFVTPGKGKVNVDGQFVLNLDGRAISFTEDGEFTIEVFLTNGNLAGQGEDWAKEHFAVGTGWGLTVSGYNAEEGTLTLTGKFNVWDAVQDGDSDHTGHASADASDLGHYDKVIIDEETALKANEDTTLKQLQGDGEDSDLTITNDTPESPKNLTLHNEDTASVNGSGDTRFAGDITVNEGVNLKKTGDAEFAIEGDLSTRGGVTVDEGTLAFGKKSKSSIDGGLSISDGAELQVDGSLTLKGESDLSESEGQLSGEGDITIGEGGSLTLGGNTLAGDHDLSFDVEKGGTLSFKGENSNFSGNITGEGTVSTEGTITLTEDGSLTGDDSSGKFLASGSERTFGGNNGGADIGATDGAKVTLQAGSTFNSLDAAVSGDKSGMWIARINATDDRKS